ncbi:hypothetical protein F0P96_17995 [Hymenobacter busanensis]|uniref:Uncharacterized protein n=1 Tax=Hymenobacter busanensis TaxID=2607656 RepID=A0A7L4ZSQ6_9BACT|nr:hypothetical protein [Hymenobacter busanensis]KAA9327130.1 hypothetical protein F0P96_17995 [Hymenobacter busanensis]QHJ05795.1 hypothetical protein GUY19_00195 [Hymenobacter busanensis]
MANKQQGQRSQSDPKAAQNQNASGQSQSNQSSAQAQQAGSIDGDRSVRSGLSGQASRPHGEGDGHHADNMHDPANPRMSRGTGMTPPSDKGSERQGSKSGQGRTGDAR